MGIGRSFRLLILTDVHYAAAPADAVGPARRRCLLGRELLRRALTDARRRGGFDAVAVLGDLLNRGDASDRADQDLAELADDVFAAIGDAPLLLVPGNHDGPAERVYKAFDERPGPRQIGHLRFFVFVDAYDQTDRCTRLEEDRRRFGEFASAGEGPIIVLQHNPVHPAIDDPYPYMHTNREQVLADYAQAGVLLSLSGHYHKGTGPAPLGGVTYFTAPALCEAPFCYSLAEIQGRDVRIRTHCLALESEPPLVDSHAHTEFAYCGRDISAADEIDRARAFGLGGLFLVEHAPQLYVTKEEFYSGQHVRRPELWTSGRCRRMDDFRQAMLPLRDGFVRVGLEVELDADDRLILDDADRGWQDILVGAVHFLNKDHSQYSDAEMAAEFMRVNRRLIQHGVHVLAHPWRVFTWFGRTVPTHLYGELADLLAASNVAAEINFHLNANDPAFFRICVQRGVKLALGSDAHTPEEMADLHDHLAFLREIAEGRELSELLAF